MSRNLFVDEREWLAHATHILKLDGATFYIILHGGTAIIIGVVGRVRLGLRALRIALSSSLPFTPSQFVWERGERKKRYKLWDRVLSKA